MKLTAIIRQCEQRKEVGITADLHPERQHAHALLDLVPSAKLGAVRHLLEGLIE